MQFKASNDEVERSAVSNSDMIGADKGLWVAILNPAFH